MALTQSRTLKTVTTDEEPESNSKAQRGHLRNGGMRTMASPLSRAALCNKDNFAFLDTEDVVQTLTTDYMEFQCITGVAMRVITIREWSRNQSG
ncbi:MAG: hypothetical protein NZ744_08165 [Pirellulaceae bacterium]|nr:hypothetical protein [Pirellulaceae bacterium]